MKHLFFTLLFGICLSNSTEPIKVEMYRPTTPKKSQIYSEEIRFTFIINSKHIKDLDKFIDLLYESDISSEILNLAHSKCSLNVGRFVIEKRIRGKDIIITIPMFFSTSGLPLNKALWEPLEDFIYNCEEKLKDIIRKCIQDSNK